MKLRTNRVYENYQNKFLKSMVIKGDSTEKKSSSSNRGQTDDFRLNDKTSITQPYTRGKKAFIMAICNSVPTSNTCLSISRPLGTYRLTLIFCQIPMNTENLCMEACTRVCGQMLQRNVMNYQTIPLRIILENVFRRIHQGRFFTIT